MTVTDPDSCSNTARTPDGTMLSSYDTIGNRGTRAKPQTDENQARQPLGHLSPNVGLKSTKSYKLQSGSPLKRPLAAALDAQNGFTYLKRRKLSSSTTPQPTVNLELQNDETASNNLATFRFAASVCQQSGKSDKLI